MGRHSDLNRKTNSNRSWYSIPLLVFLGLRIILLFALFHLTNGSEFTCDVEVYELGLNPLNVVTFFSDFSDYSQPPFFPFLLMVFAKPLSLFFGSFLASRISYIFFELVAFCLMIRYLNLFTDISKKVKSIILMIMAVSPLGFMTGAIMRQEEAVVTIFIVAVLIAVKRGSIKRASILTFIGMIAGKILVGVLFYPLLLVSKNKAEVLKWGIIPAVVFHIFYALIGFIVTGVIPFIDFAPSETQFCASPFTLILYFYDMGGQTMKWISAGLTLAVLGLLWFRLNSFHDRYFPMLAIIALGALFLTFYHINTEYHIFILPLLALIPFLITSSWKRLSLLVLHLTLSIGTWGFGIIFGIRYFKEGKSAPSQSKEIILGIYQKLLGFIPIKPFEMALLSLTLISILAIILVTCKALYSIRSADAN